MRFDTTKKRGKAKKFMVDYLCDVFGYGKLTAEYEVNLWVENGSDSLSESVKEHIRVAKICYK